MRSVIRQLLPRAHRPSALVIQVGVALCAMAVCLSAPPVDGQMLVVPLHRGSDADTTNWVMRADGRLIGRAWLGHALIVQGRRDALTMPAVRHGALLIGIPSVLCGTITKTNGDY